MAIFEGTVRVRLNAETSTVSLDRGLKSSTLTAADAPEILTAALAACKEHKAKLDRWTFYVPEIAAKLPDSAKVIEPSAAAKAADEPGAEVRITLGKFSKPRMVIGKPLEGKKRKSKYIDIC